jgi:hypothetical protein
VKSFLLALAIVAGVLAFTPTSSLVAQASGVPTTAPTTAATTYPTTVPTTVPTSIPGVYATTVPTTNPSSYPTTVPTTVPTTYPTTVPTTVPGVASTMVPTSYPTSVATTFPTTAPTTYATTYATTAPTPNGPLYHGCPVFAAGDPVIARDVTSAAIDPNSAAIIAHIPSGNFFSEGNENADFRVNLATNATASGHVGANGWRTYPVAVPGGPGNTSPGAVVPWQTGFFIEPVGDAHAEVLNTSTCVWTEMYSTVWSGSALKAYAGQQYVMSSPFYAEFAPTTVASIPLLGFTDYGEDASLASIDHPLGFFAPLSAYATTFTGAATTGEGSGTCGAATQCLEDGDILRLKASFSCPSSGPMLALCQQLKKRGITLVDAAGGYGLRMGVDSNGVDDWTGYSTFASSLTPANFDVIKRSP